MPNTSLSAKGVKRAHLLFDGVNFFVAGGFTGEAVPLSATALCTECPPGAVWCGHGFSAYRTADRAKALFRHDRRTPVVDVLLSGTVHDDIHLIGQCQQVVGIRFFPACTQCASSRNLRLAPSVKLFNKNLAGLHEMVVTCKNCAFSENIWTAPELSGILNLDVGFLSPHYKAWVECKELSTNTHRLKCACAVLPVIRVDKGWAWYLQEFWGPFQKEEDFYKTVCTVCQTTWKVYRQSWPPYAEKLISSKKCTTPVPRKIEDLTE